MCDKGIERSIQVPKSGPSNVDEQYFGIVKTIMKEDCVKRDRTGTGTISTFGTRMVLDIRDGKVPLLTSKKVYHRAIIHELLWMLSGNTDIRYLKENNVNIWDSWVDPKTAEYDAEGKLVAGNLPHIYQAQWRAWDDTRVDDPNAWEPVVTNRKIDQIAMIIDQLKNNPDSRRILLSAWNVSYIEEMALPPCHVLYQLWTRELSFLERVGYYHKITGRSLPTEDAVEVVSIMDERGIPKRAISSQMYQRSVDVCLGLPFNIVQYSILTHLIARCVNMVPEKFVWVGGDTHIYLNQLDGIIKQLDQYKENPLVDTAWMEIRPTKVDIDGFKFEDILIRDYQSLDAIRFPGAAI